MAPIISDNKKAQKNGFTLVEVIVVLVILAILLAVSIPAFNRYIDKANGMSSLANARQAYMAANLGLVEWRTAGSPGNGDKAYKINIESEIIDFLDLGEMKSYTETNSNENVVQVALSLPSYYSQGWQDFIDECVSNGYRNFVRVWVGKNLDRTIGNSIKAVYYVSADGGYASRIVYDDTTKLGSTDQRTGTYFERINLE